MTRQELYNVMKNSKFTQKDDGFYYDFQYMSTRIKLEEETVMISIVLVPSVLMRTFRYENLAYDEEFKVLAAGTEDDFIQVMLQV